MAANPAVNAKCRYCGSKLKADGPRRDRGFCGARHRLLFWALGEIVKDFKAGQAEGIREAIQNLSRSAGQ